MKSKLLLWTTFFLSFFFVLVLLQPVDFGVIKCFFSVLCQQLSGRHSFMPLHRHGEEKEQKETEGEEGSVWFAGPLHLAWWVITESWVNHACNHGYVAQ